MPVRLENNPRAIVLIQSAPMKSIIPPTNAPALAGRPRYSIIAETVSAKIPQANDPVAVYIFGFPSLISINAEMLSANAEMLSAVNPA